MAAALAGWVCAAGPDQFEELLRGGLLALQRNDLASARDQLAKASFLRPDDPRVWLGIAQARARSGDKQQGDEAAARAAKLGSGDPIVQHGLALYYANTGDLPRAAAYEARFAGATGDPEAFERAASLHLEAANPARAVELARQGLARGNRASLQNVLGKAQEAAGDSAAAIAALQEAIRLNPYEEAYYFDLAQVLMVHHNFEVAIPVLESSKRVIAKSPQLELALGVAYYGQRRFADAVDSFLRTIDLGPDIQQPYLYLARILDDARERLDEVRRRFEAYHHAHPESPLGPYLVAKAIMAQLPTGGFPEEARRAEELLRLSVQRNGEPWEPHFLLGSLLERKGELTEAETVLRRSIERNPAHPAPHLPLARVYLRLGRKEDAARERDLFKELTRKQEFAVQEQAAGMKRLKLTVQ